LQELPILTVHMQLTVMAVLIIFPLILQTVIYVRKLSIGGWSSAWL